MNVNLENNDVHIWQLNVKKQITKLNDLWEILSDDEKQRAEGFKFAEHRERFVITHGILRFLLANYLNKKPEAIKFEYGLHGKPAVNNGRKHGYALTFNMSHSHEVAIFGFTKDNEIGVDIEYIKEKIEYEDLAKRFFSDNENQDLQKISTNRRKQAFFNCWARKEAFIKAIGKGLSFPLDKFDVDINKDKKTLLLNEQNWLLCAINIASNYAAALAVANSSAKVKIQQFNC